MLRPEEGAWQAGVSDDDRTNTGGYICPSLVSYVQPRRARNTDGLWKVILNLRERYKGIDYKQNVRLEQCM